MLDSLIEKKIGSQASIIVTQPRRLAAVSVAARVSQERAQDGSVGYSIRGETKADSKTKLLFCTTGVVLRRLASDDRLGTVTHLIIDEVSLLIWRCKEPHFTRFSQRSMKDLWKSICSFWKRGNS